MVGQVPRPSTRSDGDACKCDETPAAVARPDLLEAIIGLERTLATARGQLQQHAQVDADRTPAGMGRHAEPQSTGCNGSDTPRPGRTSSSLLGRRLSWLGDSAASPGTDEHGRRRSWSAQPDAELRLELEESPRVDEMGLSEQPSIKISREARARRRRNSLLSPVDCFFAHLTLSSSCPATISYESCGSVREASETPPCSPHHSVRRRQSAPAMVITETQRVQLAAKDLRWLNLSELVEAMRRLRLPEANIDSCLEKRLPDQVEAAKAACRDAILSAYECQATTKTNWSSSQDFSSSNHTALDASNKIHQLLPEQHARRAQEALRGGVVIC